jgi:hypothetical protein
LYQYFSPVRLTATLFPSLYLKNQLLIHRRDRLYFYYAGRPVAKLHCYVLGRVIDDIPTPFLAYVDHSEVFCSREKSIRFPTWNLPVWRIRKANLARLQPTNIDQDPYLASILIALAQAQQHAYSSNTAARPSSYKVRLYLRVSSSQAFAN